MKIMLLNIESKRRECINKDFMGGYGWASLHPDIFELVFNNSMVHIYKLLFKDG